MKNTLLENIENYLYNLATDKKRGFIPAISKAILFLFSLIYGLVVRVLILFSRLNPRRLACKVISVGNLTLGGTGKTTLVAFIASYLKNRGQRIAILSRGYKRKNTDCQTMGDEPYMLAKKLGELPVIVDGNRIRGAERALRDYKVDTLILDDGFQQWRIKKDLEIVTLDATRPFGNGHLIPRGILREPVSSLRRADIVVITKTNLAAETERLKDYLKKVNPAALIFASTHHPLVFYQLGKPDELLSPETFKGRSVGLFSAIGDPDSFENLLKSLEIKVGLTLKFNDHHHYTQEDLDEIVRSCKDKGLKTIITTEKDAAKICQLQFRNYDLQIFILRIIIKIVENEERFYHRLLSLYSL